MNFNVHAAPESADKEFAKTLGEFKNLPEAERRTAYSNMLAFMMGLKLGAKLSAEKAAATTT